MKPFHVFFPLSLWAPYFYFSVSISSCWPATIEDGRTPCQDFVCLSHIQTPQHANKAPEDVMLMAETAGCKQKSSG
jgi:hypothetical protein